MKQTKHYETPEKDRISFVNKVIYGCGGFVNNILAAASGGMMIVLNLGLGMNPALVGLLGALPRLTDALTDPLMGYISDHTHSRWGRRRPYIFIGAILAGIFFAMLWQLPEGESETFYFFYFLGGSIIFYLAYTVFATPWVALGYELTPDYHERTRLMGVQSFMAQIAYLISPWFLWFMHWPVLFENQVQGASWLAIAVAVVVICLGVLPAIFLRERYQTVERHDAVPASADILKPRRKTLAENVREFTRGFLITLKFKPFLQLCFATFLVFNGFMLVSSFQFYVIIYYVFAGDQSQGAVYAGYAGTIGAAATFFVIVFVTWLATKIGKRRAFFISTGVSVVGYALKWFCYDPNNPMLLLLPAPLIAFGLGGLFPLVSSMIADVCDLDELKTGERREGMYGSIFWWVVKLGMAVALAAGGIMLNATGFDVALGGQQAGDTIQMMRLFDAFVPALCSLAAIWIISGFPITEERAHEIRQKLELRKSDEFVMDTKISL